MKINKLFHIIVIIIVPTLIVAGAMYLYHYSEMKGEQKLHDKQIASKDTTIANLKVKITRLENAIAEKPDRLPDDLLKIYTVDAMADVEGVDFCLAVPENYTVIEKVNLVSSLLMKHKFSQGVILLDGNGDGA